MQFQVFDIIIPTAPGITPHQAVINHIYWLSLHPDQVGFHIITKEEDVTAAYAKYHDEALVLLDVPVAVTPEETARDIDAIFNFSSHSTDLLMAILNAPVDKDSVMLLGDFMGEEI